MNINDIVKLKYDDEKQGLKKGRQGTIICVFEKPEKAFEVEFIDEDSETIIEATLLPWQIEKIN